MIATKRIQRYNTHTVNSEQLAKEMTLIPDAKNKDACLNCPLARCVNKCGRVSGALK